uniref:Uncharacterized protein n=1 Tax=Rhizophora mucronata TaxID=61149 RepID=A0A2P2JI70_RHIMU
MDYDQGHGPSKNMQTQLSQIHGSPKTTEGKTIHVKSKPVDCVEDISRLHIFFPSRVLPLL